MDPMKTEWNPGEGRLPAMAPLANPYVPFQLNAPPKYEPRKALVRGTLYPGLDLPFMGMVNQNELPMNASTELQALAFMVQELALYLDTHADDKEALGLYQNYQQALHKRKMECNEERPLSHAIPGKGDRYRWLDDPWPWEYTANKEG